MNGKINDKIQKDFFQASVSFIFVLTVFGMLAVFTSGCGKKAPPLPSLQYMLPPPATLTYTLAHDRIILNWNYSSKKHDRVKCHGFKIFKAEKELSGKGCMGCPLKFRQIASVSSSQFNYTEKIKKGLRYYYRVSAYSDNNVLSDMSNTVEVNYK